MVVAKAPLRPSIFTTTRASRIPEGFWASGNRRASSGGTISRTASPSSAREIGDSPNGQHNHDVSIVRGLTNGARRRFRRRTFEATVENAHRMYQMLDGRGVWVVVEGHCTISGTKNTCTYSTKTSGGGLQ